LGFLSGTDAAAHLTARLSAFGFSRRFHRHKQQPQNPKPKAFQIWTDAELAELETWPFADNSPTKPNSFNDVLRNPAGAVMNPQLVRRSLLQRLAL
jgi:hypothetical protein